MTWSVRALASPSTAAGFRLAGIPADEVTDPAAIGEFLKTESARPGLGILLVEQPLLDAAPETLRREIERRPVPLIVPVPAPSWEPAAPDAESYILELLRRAIGYRVKLR